MGAGGAKMGLSPEEIAKVKQEWEERQKNKESKKKDKGASQDGDGNGDKKAEEKSSKSPPGSASPPSTATSPPTKPSHERYTLHRNIFALRLAEHRRRKQATQAKELAPRLPGAPRSPLP